MKKREPEQPDMVGEIRRAAFDLRRGDPSEAVRVLRRLLREAGPAEPLVHGALGEILLEDFDDVDGALHHFRRLVALAPELPAGHLGLGRALAKNDDRLAAARELATAREGLVRLVEEARATPDRDHPGADEALLSALELAFEEHDLAGDAAPMARFDPSLFAFAEEVRLFDADEADDLDDWERYGRLCAALEAQGGELEAALATAARIADRAPLPEPRRHQLRSVAFEAAGRWAEAAREAVLATDALDGAFVAEEVLRTASLLSRAGDEAQARALLDRLRARLEAEKARTDEEGRAAIDTVLEELSALVAPGAPALVTLGRRGQP